ncbi:ATP-binding cassette domain-containing protein [Tenuibacillus multivorans]|uniref:ABC-2 type transport system ATP-binding protein n=1 Tax=Tenuibacillus multivorans TaxID=237069 RepID=A0A1H0APF5_9BACI|nr:ABC transporter ATP-binding protein [Tenuibacillus multivorans]GEL78210.1 ABC transporter [Tenuibacillus multivorans]SDN34806.1 ABC-2 type transport system ATP-binding protein [Tenuibacillus multivorans]
MGIITCQNVSKSFKRTKALNGFNATFMENRLTGLIGRNGAGKTTLLKMIVGHGTPEYGRIQVFGENPFNNLKVSANTIFVDDEMVFPAEMKLHEIIKMAGLFYDNWDGELAERLMIYFGLNKGVFHDQLSKGKRSTFNMIFGLSARCPLTVFDEPTTGMDYSVRQDFYRALLKEYINHPRTIILSSHLLNELEGLLEDIILIKNGECLIHESMEDFKAFAVGLTGSKEHIEAHVREEDVFYRKNVGSTQSYVVVRDQFSQDAKADLKESGIQVTKVDAADLSMHLTSETKGGIDDVFKQS